MSYLKKLHQKIISSLWLDNLQSTTGHRNKTHGYVNATITTTTSTIGLRVKSIETRMWANAIT